MAASFASHRYLSSLKRLGEYRDLHDPQEPAGAVRVEHLCRAPRRDRNEVPPLTSSEVDTLLDTILERGRPTERWRNWTLVWLVCASGPPPGDVCALGLHQLRPDAEKPTHIAVERGDILEMVELPQDAQSPLKTWLRMRRSEEPRVRALPYVCPILSSNRSKCAGDAITEQGLRAIITRYARLAGIERRVTPTLLKKSHDR